MKKHNINEFITMFSKREYIIIDDEYKDILNTLRIVRDKYTEHIKTLENLMDNVFVFEDIKYKETPEIREISILNSFDDKYINKYNITVKNQDKYIKVLEFCKKIKSLEMKSLKELGFAVDNIQINNKTSKEDIVYVLENLDNKNKNLFVYNVKTIYRYFKNYNVDKLEAFTKLVKDYMFINKKYGNSLILGNYIESYVVEPKNKVIEDYIKEYATKVKFKEETLNNENFKNIVDELTM